MNKKIYPSRIGGTINIPPSKSHTIRAIFIAIFAKGESIIKNPLLSEDTKSCIKVCENFGAKIEHRIEDKKDILKIEGINGKINYSGKILDVGNSGTTLFLALALATLSESPIYFTGDKSIQKRSTKNLTDALKKLGAKIEYQKEKGFVPLTICGPLKSGKCEIDCPTSQYLTALMLALPLADGNFDIEVKTLLEKPYIDLTMWWLNKQYIMIDTDKKYNKLFIPGGQKYKSQEVEVPADYSSAAFFFSAAAITESTLILKNLTLDDSQGDKEIISILYEMGCIVEAQEGQIKIEGKELQGIEIDMTDIPDLLPILAVLGCKAKGKTVLYNASHTRAKETDRIETISRELVKMGAKVLETPDSLTVFESPLKGATLDSNGDHRIAMALAVASLIADSPSQIKNSEVVTITYPNFFDELKKIQK